MSAFMQIMALLLVVCGLLLLWGCTTRSWSVPVVEASPPLLATVHMPLPFVETLPARLMPRPAFASTSVFSLAASPSAAIALPQPACYRQAQQVMICLGQMVNTGAHALQNLRLRVTLGSQSRTISPEQWVVAPGQAAPYRALFFATGAERASTALESAMLHPGLLPNVQIVDERTRYEAGRSGYGVFYYEARLLLRSADLDQPWQAVITLFGDDDDVVGYRVIESEEPLRRGVPVRVSTQIIPLALAQQYHARLVVSPR